MKKLGSLITSSIKYQFIVSFRNVGRIIIKIRNQSMKDSGLKVKEMVEEKWYVRMVQFTKETGGMTNLMERED